MIDLLIVLAFVAYSVAAGLKSRKKAGENLQEYFLAGKTISGWRAGVSMAATQFAADTPLLVAGLIATGGVFLVWRLWIYGIAFLMMGFVFAARWRRAGVLTDAELVELRYSGRGTLLLRVLKAVYYGTIINCVVMAMVLVAAMRIAEVFLPWHEWLPAGFYSSLVSLVTASGFSMGESLAGLEASVYTTNSLISTLAIVAFTALYSTTGGLRSVITTDVMQFVIAMAATLLYALFLLDKAGGLSGLPNRLTELYGTDSASRFLSFAPEGGEAFMPFLIIVGLQWLFQMNSDGTGYLAQRSMACRSDEDAERAAVVFSWLQIVLRSLIWIVIGLCLLVVYPIAAGSSTQEGFAASREMLFVSGIDEFLPVGVKGLMLTGLLAALASTIDTHLNWGASYWSNDVYKRLICKTWLRREASSGELVLAARCSNVLILVISFILMSNLGSIQMAWHISLLFGAGAGAVLVLRWLWERVNLYSEFAAIILSLLFAPVLLFYVEDEWARLSLMAAASTLAAVLAAFAAPQTKAEVLQNFYQKVRPSGFWRQTARLAGEDPRKPLKMLLSEALRTLLASLSLFLALVGAGKLLLGGAALYWGCLLAAAILVPFWIRRSSTPGQK